MLNIPKKTLWTGVGLILATGLIHLVEVPDSFEEAGYKGVLFILNGLGALVAAFGIYRGQKTLGWTLGMLIAAGSFAGYVASRTVGLPGIPAEPENWLEPMGVASLVAEGLFVMTFLKVAGTKER